MPTLPLPMFTAPSYGDRTLNEVQRCVNLYPEKTPSGWKLVSGPGYTLWATAPVGFTCRGVHYVPPGANSTAVGRLFAVYSTTLYEIDTAGTFTSRGTLSSLADPADTTGLIRAYMTDDGTYLVIRSGDTGLATGQIFNLSSNTLSSIADTDFPARFGPVAWKDGRFIVHKNNTGDFYISASGDPTSWNALDFDVANVSRSDVLKGVFVVQENLFLVGELTVEIWSYTGNPSFPFEPLTGSSVPVGTPSITSVAVLGESIFFLGSGSNKKYAIYEVRGTDYRTISTPDIEERIRTADPTACHATTFQYYGHDFYQITFAGIDKTYVYDATMQSWWERDTSTAGAAPYVEEIARFILPGFLNDGSHLVFTNTAGSGAIYKMSPAVNSENGSAMRRLRVFGPIEAGSMRMFHSRIRFVLEADHDSSASYTLSATLDWSDNGGLTWSTARTLSKAVTTGTTGQKIMLQADRLGSSRQRYYRLTFTGPAARLVLQSAELEYEVGGH